MEYVLFSFLCPNNAINAKRKSTVDPVEEECLDLATVVNPGNMLPEVTEFQYNLNDAYLELCEVKVSS